MWYVLACTADGTISVSIVLLLLVSNGTHHSATYHMVGLWVILWGANIRYFRGRFSSHENSHPRKLIATKACTCISTKVLEKCLGRLCHHMLPKLHCIVDQLMVCLTARALCLVRLLQTPMLKQIKK